MRHLPIPRAGFGCARAPVLSALLLMFGLCAALSANAALPLPWRADWPNCKPVEKLLHRGVDVALQPTFYVNGLAADTNGWQLSTYVQTNAVGAWFGPLPGAFFSHTNDVGAAFYSVMVRAEAPGGGVNYTAFARFRMLDSPGFAPGELPLPAKYIDFADVTVINPPWGDVDFSPGNTQLVATIEAVAPAPGNYAVVSNAAMNAVSRAEVEAGLDGKASTNSVQQLDDMATARRVPVTISGCTMRRTPTGLTVFIDAANDIYIIPTATGFRVWYQEVVELHYDLNSGDSLIVTLPGGETISYIVGWSYLAVESDVWPLVEPRLSYMTNDIAAVRAVADAAAVTNAAQSAAIDSLSTSLAPIPGQISNLGSQVNAIGAHLNAEDARFVSTNYNSAAHMPEAYVEVKVSNSWLTVWREMTRWDWFLGIYTNDFAMLSAALATKGAKEYAFYDGVTGAPAPDGFFWISQPRVAIAAGMSYQRYVDSGAAVWVLESNGMVVDLNGTTNGFFRIGDDEGNTHFEIVKGNARTVGAAAGAMTHSTVMGVTHYFTTYAVTNAASAPVAMFARDLKSAEWYAETDGGCPCNVSWTNPESGVYVCEWWPKSTEPTIFMKAEYGQGIEARIVQNAPVEMQYIVVGGVKYTLDTAIIDGKTVLTLTP